MNKRQDQIMLQEVREHLAVDGIVELPGMKQRSFFKSLLEIVSGSLSLLLFIFGFMTFSEESQVVPPVFQEFVLT
ncbi:MAG: hypothetical protein ACYDH1_10690 [Anaerolineaceae bacterium]|jgi:hypothetical protein|nr:MAG: hypothetical protein CVU46_12050 [Chloroflexi bacterium HGW-Chloroflexi-8]